MGNKIVDIHNYKDKRSTLEIVLDILANWNANKSAQQSALDTARLKSLLPALFQELPDGEPDLKVKLITLLGQTGISESTPFLLAYLNDADHDIKESVIRALGLIGDHFAILPLKNAYLHELPDLQSLILQSLEKLVDDQFFFQLLGTEPNLNKITIALEILDMLTSESNQLLSPGGFRQFLDQLVPHFQQIRRSEFDVKTLKQTINTLQDELYKNQEKSGYSVETMKFQLKIQHNQLQNFLVSSSRIEEEPTAEIVAQPEEPFEAAESPLDIHPLMETLTRSVESISARLDRVTQKLDELPPEPIAGVHAGSKTGPAEEIEEGIFEEIAEGIVEGTEDEVEEGIVEEIEEEIEGERELGLDFLNFELAESDHELMQGLFENETGQQTADVPQIEGTVFVLEDSPLMLKTIQGLMLYTGFADVKTFSNPMLALEAYKKEYENLVLITTDWQMPVMDGREFMKVLREFEQQEGLPTCPIIFITDETNIYRVRILLEEGAQEVISKPFIPGDLIKAVTQVTGIKEMVSSELKSRGVLDLKEVIIAANLAVLKAKTSKHPKKTLKYHKSIKISRGIQEDLDYCLKLVISISVFLSHPNETVFIDVTQLDTDETTATITLKGITPYLSTAEIASQTAPDTSETSNGFLADLQNIIGTDSAAEFSLDKLMDPDGNPSLKEEVRKDEKAWQLEGFIAAHPQYGDWEKHVTNIYGLLDCFLEDGEFCLTFRFSWPLEEDRSIPTLKPIDNQLKSETDDEVEAFQYLVELEEDGDIKTIIGELEKLCVRKPTQIFYLVDYLHEGHFERAQREILEMFQKLNRIDVIPYLIRRFPHLHKEFKLWTLSFIAEHDIRYGFFFIISVMRDQDKDVRHRAMAVLVEHFDMRFLPLMVHSLKHTFKMPKTMDESTFLQRLPVRERSAVLSILLFASDFEKSLPMLLGYLNSADKYECEQIYKTLGHQESLKFLQEDQISILTLHFQENQVLERFPHLVLQLLKSTVNEFLSWILGKINHGRWKDVFKARFIDDIKSGWEALNDFLVEGITEISQHIEKAGDLALQEQVSQQEAEELYRMLHMSKGAALSLDLEILGAMYHHLESILSSIMPISSPMDISEHRTFKEKVGSAQAVTVIANSILAQAFKNDTFLKKAIFVHHLFPRLEQTAHKLETMLRKKLDIRFLEESILQVDSGLFQILNNCLIQFVKNSIDHGIELPEERLKQNKPERAVLDIRISVKDKKARILIQDDGAGLDTDKILSKAVEKKILSQEAAEVLKNDPNQKNAIFDLVYSSQLSTAKNASMVSGRGVGMDIVRSEIVKLGGEIECESEKGKGTSFCVILPMQMSEHFIIEETHL
ncbi:MAG: response regulator [SAR324 cluster bacterium]|nr:response regulator [SAR324 cluster bacterium]